MRFKSTGRARVHSDKACVLYDSKDGEICYVHRVVTMEGADETPEKEIEKRTLQLAKEVKIDLRTTKLLHVDASAIEPNMQYVVDPKKRCLVPRPVDDEIIKKKTMPKRSK